jgi:hypothetical protein
MRNQKLIHPTRCSQLLSHRGVLVLITFTLWEWEWDVVMQHIYIVKHDRATIKIYRYTLQIKLHFSEHDIYFVSCRGQLRDLAARGWGIRTGRIRLPNR